jgi:hypothetical protein
MSQYARRGRRERQSGDSATAGQGDRFCEHLANQTAASGPERGADSHLFLPRNITSQQQVGKVRANDQHHHSYRARQYDQRRAEASTGVFLECLDSGLKIS